MCSITHLKCRSATVSSAPSCCGCPDVRPHCAKRAVFAALGAVRVYAKLSLLLTKRGEGRTAYGADVRGLRGAQAERSGKAVVTEPSHLVRSGVLCDGVCRSARLAERGSLYKSNQLAD